MKVFLYSLCWPWILSPLASSFWMLSAQDWCPGLAHRLYCINKLYYTVKMTGIWGSTKEKLILSCLCKIGTYRIYLIYIKQLRYLNKVLHIIETLTRILKTLSLQVIFTKARFLTILENDVKWAFTFHMVSVGFFFLSEDINMRVFLDFVVNCNTRVQTGEHRVEWWRWFFRAGSSTGSGWCFYSECWDAIHLPAWLPKCEWCVCGVKFLRFQMCVWQFWSFFLPSLYCSLQKEDSVCKLR